MSKKPSDSILYIDDVQLNLDSFYYLFRDQYKIYTALNTSDAENILNNTPIKVVISDQVMPKENGLDFIKRIKPAFPNIVFILVTAYTDSDTILDAFNNKGIYRFIPKPWDTNDMKQAIENAFDRYTLTSTNKELLDSLQEKNITLSEQNKALRELTASIKENEIRFKSIFNLSHDSICIVDEAGNIQEVNPAFCKRTKKNRTDLLKNNFVSILDNSNKTVLNRYFEQLKKIGEVEFETNLQIVGCEQVHLEMLCKKLTLKDQTVYMAVARDVTEQRVSQQKILKSTIIAEETERRRIAQELHDGIGPLLTSIKLFSETLINSDKADLKAMLSNQIVQSLDDAIDQISAISNNLSPHVLQNHGLVSAVDNFCTNIQLSANIDIKTEYNIPKRIAQELEITLYRLIIELLNNTVKHAHASKVFIRLHKKEEQLHFYYADNGIGFKEIDNNTVSTGMGLYNIKNRVEAMEGSFSFTSDINKGVKYKILLPIKDNIEIPENKQLVKD